MPRSKKTLSDNFNFSRLNLQESYVSLALGAVVVIVIAAVLFLILSGGKGKVTLTGLKTAIEEQLKKSAKEEPKKVEVYEVKEGDTLFLITQKKYGDGFKYPQIASLNKIANPDLIEVGMKLNLPEKLETSKLKTYTVAEGDSLWSIAVESYGDGFRWTEIASHNNLVDPDYLWVGTKLNLP